MFSSGWIITHGYIFDRAECATNFFDVYILEIKGNRPEINTGKAKEENEEEEEDLK